MATRGRKPTPEHLKVLKGIRSDRLNPLAPTPARGQPDRPDHLDAVAAVEWDRLSLILDRMGVLTEADGAALAIYCEAFSRARLAEDAIRSKGLVIETSLGGIKANPASAILSACEATMTRILAEFGLTPSSRSSLKISSPEKPKDSLGDFLAARPGR